MNVCVRVYVTFINSQTARPVVMKFGTEIRPVASAGGGG